MFCFLFFFKQKTAYEMRISDWSSDVCSSDLGAHWLHSADVNPLTRIAEELGHPYLARPRPFDGRFHLGHGWEIGRASCRERVCSVRVDLGGRRIIKNKNHKYKNYYRSTTPKGHHKRVQNKKHHFIKQN